MKKQGLCTLKEIEMANKPAEEAAITEPKKTSEGWSKFGDYWFLLDSVREFKETGGMVSEINGRTLGASSESSVPLGCVFSVLEEHAKQRNGGENSKGSLPPSPLPSESRPKGSQRSSLG